MEEVHGLIQHSFGLQLTEPRRPFSGLANCDRLSERFALPDGPLGRYDIKPVGKETFRGEQYEPLHSPIAEFRHTTVESRGLKYLQRRGDPAVYPKMPDVLDWAEASGAGDCADFAEPRFIFTDRFDDEFKFTQNDFLVVGPRCLGEAAATSLALLEVMAHKRSRLFGFALANRFVNVMLPHALLKPSHHADGARAWLMLPLVSFIRGGRDRGRLRKVYSLTFFFIPVEQRVEHSSRPMSFEEIKWIVNASWSYATAKPPSELPQFDVSGPLLDYLSQLTKFDLHEMRREREPLVRCGVEPYGSFTLRQTVERVAFGVGLGLAQGKGGSIGTRPTELLGNEVVMALGSTRVSSVTFVDPELEAWKVTEPINGARPFPGKLLPLLEELSKPIRFPRWGDPEGCACRLDRPFVDSDLYAIGALPARRCLVVASRKEGQCGSRESALMQAGSIAYMALSSASAIGAMRSIDCQVEHLEGADPREVARLDEEIATDLNEIYDLDITRESYREIYRRLRDRFGIDRDYETLQDEMQTLYRATATFHEHRSELLLAWLTAAIVFLSVLILIGTVIVALKGG